MHLILMKTPVDASPIRITHIDTGSEKSVFYQLEKELVKSDPINYHKIRYVKSVQRDSPRSNGCVKIVQFH